jgi:hypothetical protein
LRVLVLRRHNGIAESTATTPTKFQGRID